MSGENLDKEGLNYLLKHLPTAYPANGGNAATVNGHSVNADVPSNAKFTDTTYSAFVKSGSSAKEGLVPKPSTTAGTTKYLREDGTWTVPPDTNTTYSNFVKSGSGAKSGLVPAPSTTAGTSKYLREDGTWQTPPNTTYSDMKGATVSAAGTHGLVPAPSAGKQESFLRGDGAWDLPANISNPNLLDNPDFKINQRGVSSISSAIGVDRWYGNYTVDSTGVKWGPGHYFLQQTFDRSWFAGFNGKQLTFSMSMNGTVYSGTITLAQNASSLMYDTAQFVDVGGLHVDIYSPDAVRNPFLRIFGDSNGEHIEWVKLELGDKATPFVPPHPSLELLKCQRYYWRTPENPNTHYKPSIMVLYKIVQNPKQACFIPSLHASVRMAGFPIAKVNGAALGETVSLRSTDNGLVVSGSLAYDIRFSLCHDGLVSFGVTMDSIPNNLPDLLGTFFEADIELISNPEI